MIKNKSSLTSGPPVGNRSQLLYLHLCRPAFPSVLQLQWVTWCSWKNKWAGGLLLWPTISNPGTIRYPRNRGAHNSNTGANKTQTKQSNHLWRSRRSGCRSSFQQYTERNILSTSMLFRAFLQIFGEKEGRWNTVRTMGLWLCYGVRAPRPASPL